MSEPVRFAFGLHLHQPVGNFDHVFAQHVADVYRPLLREVIGGGLVPATLHVSGPLLDWLLAHDPAYLDELGGLAADGRVELLLAGYDEPILAVLPREDRLEQIERMRAALRARFGVTATGLWLTERVWEPDLAGDLHDAGVRYALVDDRHFLVAGFERAQLHRPWRTEQGGRSLALLAIDETLRYLVPFRPPAELADYFRRLREEGQPLAVLADDGEKFGGWPGTREWVYQRGWLRDFLATLARLQEENVVRLVTCSEALARVEPGGLAYLPSASYREMEEWALPPVAAHRLDALERELGEKRLRGALGGLVRGSHWRHFLVKYPEANRMHKKMLALSALCRARGEPAPARRAIGRAQCNDAYWHGVFGGLYLPHLREAVWRELARAEAELRRGEPAGWEAVDLDQDGRLELWLHSAAWSLVVSPARGGAIEEWTAFGPLTNYAAVLTRRREVYHETQRRNDAKSEGEGGDAGTMRDFAQALDMEGPPPVDRETRAILQERLWAAGVTPGALERGEVVPIRSWTAEPAEWEVRETGDGLLVELRLAGLTKRLAIGAGGVLDVALRWDRDPGWPADAWLATELSLFRPLGLEAPGAVVWRHPIETVAKSEKGLDRTLQGEAVTLAWPAALGEGGVRAWP